MFVLEERNNNIKNNTYCKININLLACCKTQSKMNKIVIIKCYHNFELFKYACI